MNAHISNEQEKNDSLAILLQALEDGRAGTLPASVLAKGWDGLWDTRIAVLIREEAREISEHRKRAGTKRAPGDDQAPAAPQIQDTPGVQWQEIEDRRYLFHPCPYELIRCTRRLFARFHLESFIEDRSYGDYRNAFDQERIALVQETLETLRRCRETRGILQALVAQCAAPAAVDPLNAMIEAIDATSAQTQAALLFRDGGFCARLFEVMRGLHKEVQSVWGTWVRRIRSPALFAIFAALLVIVLHVFSGLVFGASGFLRAGFFIPLAVFGWRYYGGRDRVSELIRRTAGKLAAFDPEPMADGLNFNDYTIWSTTDANEIEKRKLATYGVIYNEVGRVQGSDDFNLRDIRVSNQAWGWVATILIAVGILAPLAGWWKNGSLPRFSVLLTSASKSCELANGYLLWPGPGDMIVWRRASGSVLVPRSDAVALFQSGQGEKGADSCTVANSSTATTSTEISLVNFNHIADRGVLTIPFLSPTSPISCEFGEASEGVRIMDGSPEDKVLKAIGTALATCDAAIDVRGFASSTQFNGSCDGQSDAKNKDLAEKRRLSTLKKLGFIVSETADPVRPGIQLIPASRERWSSYRHMHDFDHIRDTVDPHVPELKDLSQRVEIWIEDFGKCRARDIPFASR